MGQADTVAGGGELRGPLSGVRVLLLPSIGPGPMAAHVLQSLGAQTIRVDWRTPGAAEPTLDLATRQTPWSRSIALDLKHEKAIEIIKRLAERSDVVIAGFGDSVAERLGLDGKTLRNLDPRLVYASLGGWLPDSAMATNGGHDINYAAYVGALAHIGPAEGPPSPPMHFVGVANTAYTLATGILAALVERSVSGRGQCLDTSIVRTVAFSNSLLHDLNELDQWHDGREGNRIDGGAPFYRCYETADGHYMAVGAVEDKFYQRLVAGLGLVPDELPDRWDKANWLSLRALFAERFATQTRQHWTQRFAALDACVTPVLTVLEAAAEPALSGVVGRTGNVQAPFAFDRTPTWGGGDAIEGVGEATAAVLAELGFEQDAINGLLGDGVAWAPAYGAKGE